MWYRILGVVGGVVEQTEVTTMNKQMYTRVSVCVRVCVCVQRQLKKVTTNTDLFYEYRLLVVACHIRINNGGIGEYNTIIPPSVVYIHICSK